MQKFWKLVKIWQSYRELKGGNFLGHSVDAATATAVGRWDPTPETP